MTATEEQRRVGIGWIAAALLIVASFLFPVAIDVMLFITAAVFFAVGVTRRLAGMRLAVLAVCMVLSAAALTVLVHLEAVAGNAGGHFWLKVIGFWLGSWMLVETLVHDADTGERKVAGWEGLLPTVIFGVVLLLLWEWIGVGTGVQAVILPSPSVIGAKIGTSLAMLFSDFQRTFLLEALVGWALGSFAGFAVAIVADRIPFLRRGLLPLGNFVSALPVIGIAPIMVTWFGFDWHSKVAVVVIMTFFPMLVNTVAGLAASGAMERDLMRSYGASYGASLLRLRLPAAMPFIFNGLKINSTLAMIGAIVAEYFGGPTFGMGFRINTQAGLLQLDLVWAEIAVAALAGSLFYGAIAYVERRVTFWHPSYRRA
jgi:NitT/TauT family transport system permease protein